MSSADPGREVGQEAEAAAVISSLAVGYVALNRQWVFTQVNGAAEQILGRAAGDLLGRDMWVEFPGARELEFGRVYEYVMQTRQPGSLEAYYEGLGLWLEMRIQPTRDGVACYFLDITSRRVAAERAAAIASRAKLAADVSEALGSSLDLAANVGRLAQLVVPYLGEWSIVSLIEVDGSLHDAGHWHVDPDLRADVAMYARLRLDAFKAESFTSQAIRTQSTVVVGDAAYSQISARMRDGAARLLIEYLQPQFCAVLPMVASGRVVGLLSIYGNTEWSEDLARTARDIADRAALSIDNSQAYERVHSVGRRLALYAQVSDALSSIDDPDAAVGRLARLVVPQLADWSIVTLIDEDGHRRDVGWAHRDPEGERILTEYLSHTRTTRESSPLHVSLRTGEPLVVANLGDGYLAWTSGTEEAMHLARSLDPHGAIVMPLTARGKAFGILALLTGRERGSHTPEEIATAHEVALRAGPVLESARAAQRAIKLAESMQRSVLTIPQAAAGVTVATRYRPADHEHEVGGDWYDTFALPNGATVITIGDVIGHDIPAIAAMAQLRTIMRATAWTGDLSPAQVLEATDDASFGLGPGTFATTLTGDLTPTGIDGSMTFRWSSAGHLPPALLHPDGHAELLAKPPDRPLGVNVDSVRNNHSVVIAPGSTLLLYTDGLIERRSRSIDVGLATLTAALAEFRTPDLEQLLDTLLAELIDSAHDDDVAMLAIRISPAAPDNPSTVVASGVIAFETAAAAASRAKLAPHTAHLSQEAQDDAALMVTELVSNAVRHGSSPIELVIRAGPDAVLVEVIDGSPQLPTLPEAGADPATPSGRGLLIVEALATRWGVRPTADGKGKTVWFVLSG